MLIRKREGLLAMTVHCPSDKFEAKEYNDISEKICPCSCMRLKVRKNSLKEGVNSSRL
jgi:hypothetical protein